jgi:hypothetical protein
MILFLITLAIVAAKPLNPKKVIYAVNCGAPSNYKSPSGIAYEKVNLPSNYRTSKQIQRLSWQIIA